MALRLMHVGRRRSPTVPEVFMQSNNVLLRRALASALLLAIGTVASLVAPTALAADPVTDAIARAYAPYRAALFRTNQKSQADAQQAMDEARKAWNELVARHAKTPACPYDRDAGFAAALARVTAVYDKATTEIGKNLLAEAHETLEEARDVLSDLRRRSGVITFSDHMNAYHAEMEHVMTDGPKLAGTPAGLLELTARFGALQYLAQRLRTEAPEAFAKSEEFAAAAKAVEQSVADLRAALLRPDAAAVREAIGKLKGPYSRMFLRFG
jgi:hypothetical protein